MKVAQGLVGPIDDVVYDFFGPQYVVLLDEANMDSWPTRALMFHITYSTGWLLCHLKTITYELAFATLLLMLLSYSLVFRC